MKMIGKYEWGVEYATNGKRPDLADDVEVEITQHDGFVMCHKCQYIRFEHVAKFKITDPRYKPVSEISESKPDEAIVSEKLESNWFERGEFPPAGTYCQFQLTDGTGNWVDCFIIGVDDLGFCVCRADMDYLASMSASSFRPIRTHREKVIEAASLIMMKNSGSYGQAAEALYNAGMLVLPQDSSDTKD